jgi:hypothetical protein
MRKGRQVSVNAKQYAGSSIGDQTRVIAMPTHEGNVVRADYTRDGSPGILKRT